MSYVTALFISIYYSIVTNLAEGEQMASKYGKSSLEIERTLHKHRNQSKLRDNKHSVIIGLDKSTHGNYHITNKRR